MTDQNVSQVAEQTSFDFVEYVEPEPVPFSPLLSMQSAHDRLSNSPLHKILNIHNGYINHTPE